jgi:Putative MetA-pathway of phenol degradation
MSDLASARNATRRRVLLMKGRRSISVLAVSMLLLAANQAQAGKLKDLLPNLFGPGGITQERITTLGCCPGGGHEPHFQVESEAELTTLNDALRGQLGNFPLPSPASGFTFQFDPALGTFTRSTESFGPIFADRAETVGRGKLSVGFSYSRFTYDKLDGKNLDTGELQLTFLHDPTDPTAGRGPPFAFEVDTVTAQIFADITTDLFVLSGTFGVLEDLDVSFAIPIVRNSMDVKGIATSNNESNTRLMNTTLAHKFADGSTTLTRKASDEATGLGDILLRAKYNFYRQKPLALAAALDLRLPTGDEDDLLGTGAAQVSPFFIASAAVFGFYPHVNVGFILSSTADLANEFFFRSGFDWPMIKQVTFAFDLLGRLAINNDQPKAGRPPGSSETSGDFILDAAIGVKVNPWRNVLLLLNGLVALNDAGLRDTITPLIGVEVSF